MLSHCTTRRAEQIATATTAATTATAAAATATTAATTATAAATTATAAAATATAAAAAAPPPGHHLHQCRRLHQDQLDIWI